MVPSPPEGRVKSVPIGSPGIGNAGGKKNLPNCGAHGGKPLYDQGVQQSNKEISLNSGRGECKSRLDKQGRHVI